MDSCKRKNKLNTYYSKRELIREQSQLNPIKTKVHPCIAQCQDSQSSGLPESLLGQDSLTVLWVPHHVRAHSRSSGLFAGSRITHSFLGSSPCQDSLTVLWAPQRPCHSIHRLSRRLRSAPLHGWCCPWQSSHGNNNYKMLGSLYATGCIFTKILPRALFIKPCLNSSPWSFQSWKSISYWKSVITNILVWPLTVPCLSCSPRSFPSPWAFKTSTTWGTLKNDQVWLPARGGVLAAPEHSFCVLTLRIRLPDFTSLVLISV